MFTSLLTKSMSCLSLPELQTFLKIWRPSVFLPVWWVIKNKFLVNIFQNGLSVNQVPEYCRTFDETEIRENVFNLICAFDEIIALGYRENVNLAQIRSYVEMDSNEEKIYQAVRQVGFHVTIQRPGTSNDGIFNKQKRRKLNVFSYFIQINKFIWWDFVCSVDQFSELFN